MKPREIFIVPVLNGFVVHVGCQKVIVHSAEQLGANVTAYYKNPAQTEVAYVKDKVNDMLDPSPVAACQHDDINSVGTIGGGERPVDSPRAVVATLNPEHPPYRR